MIITHNMAAMKAAGNLKTNSNDRSKKTRNLTTGYKINTASDDAAGLTISEKMRWQIRGLMRGSQNAQDGISLIQVGDGALSEIHSILQRINELAVQAANDTNTDDDRNAIQEEIDSLNHEITNISNNTEFNTIKIFKPTEAPTITGNPTDILVYREDYAGGVREGGIIYNGIRYPYDEMNLSYDDAGNNILAGTYTVSVLGQTGKPVNINLIFDGSSRVPSGREYHLEPNQNGIYIDDILHTWDSMTNVDNPAETLDVNNLKDGTFEFKHAGLTITFNTHAGMDLDSLIERIKPDGLGSYKLYSSSVTTNTPKVTPTHNMTTITATSANQQYIPGNTTSNNSSYKMGADDTYLWLYIPSSQSHGQGEVILDKVTWASLGITDEDFMVDSIPNKEGLNPDSTVTGGEVARQYTYTDSNTGASITFTIDSEVSKSELISAVNNWQIDVRTNTQMVFTPTGNGITAGSHSSALDAYGTQYAMGRQMDSVLTLQSGTDISYSGDALSYTMTDATGKTYTMTAQNATAQATNAVKSALTTYITAYASNYENRLNGRTTTTLSSYTGTGSIKFTEETDSKYWMYLQSSITLDNLLDDSYFKVSYSYDTNGRKIYHVANSISDTSPILNQLSGNIANLANDIISRMDASTIAVKTNNPPITATNTITSTTRTKNKAYSSSRTVEARSMNIQVGAKGGQGVKIYLPAVDTSILGTANIDVMSYENASSAIAAAANAIKLVSEMRTSLGTTQNRLAFASDYNNNAVENTQASESLIRDADMAEEMVEYSKHNILVQAAQSLLAQANQSKSAVLSLLG